jgi:Tellurite resistance protein TerB.
MALKTVLTRTVFNKLFNTSKPSDTYTPGSEQEAWIAIMYASMYIDGHIADVEVKKMFDLVEKLPLFKRKHVADYYQPALLAHRKVGSYNLIDGSIALIQEDQKTVLFEMIMQLLLADKKLLQKEKEVAAYLTTALNLEFDVAKKIVDDAILNKPKK